MGRTGKPSRFVFEMKPILSLVTGTRNRPGSFKRLVDSVETHTDMAWEMIVADASDVPLTSDHPRVRILPERPRRGMSRGYNQACREARGEFVLWLNDDAEVLAHYAEEAIRFMRAYPEIGLGALYYAEGATDFHVNAYFGMVYANFGILRRELGDAIGWFDEEIPMYGNDNALTFKVLLAGKGVSGIPQARLLHHPVFDRERLENLDETRRAEDAERLVRKYAPQIHRMREVYRSTENAANTGPLYDQTPGWMKAELAE